MMDGGIKASRFGSVTIRILIGVLTPVIVAACLWGMADFFRAGQYLGGVLLLCLFLFWWMLMDLALRDGPLVYLTEAGIWVRAIFRRRFYPWTQIVQAGIVYRSTYRGDRNWPCLLLPGGSPMGQKDRTFVFRNYGRIVWIRNSPAVLHYVAVHYGPLDFDLSRRENEWRQPL